VSGKLVEALVQVAHSQRGMREILQGMALPVFNDFLSDPGNANPNKVRVQPKSAVPLQLVKSIIYSTSAANSTLKLGTRTINIPLAETRSLGPLWLLLHPGDERSLSVPAASAVYLELEGYEIPNTAIGELLFRLQ
jgi:hypothetical protein